MVAILAARVSAHDAGSNYGPCVTIYAPGHEIKSAHLGAFNAFRNDPYWLLLAQNRGDDYYASSTVESVSSGTSFSAAIVSGIAARLLSHPARNTWRAYDFWQYLRSYSTNIGNIDGLWGSEYLVYISVYD